MGNSSFPIGQRGTSLPRTGAGFLHLCPLLRGRPVSVPGSPFDWCCCPPGARGWLPRVRFFACHLHQEARQGKGTKCPLGIASCWAANASAVFGVDILSVPKVRSDRPPSAFFVLLYRRPRTDLTSGHFVQKSMPAGLGGPWQLDILSSNLRRWLIVDNLSTLFRASLRFLRPVVPP
jgi:hypothetical protein